MQHVIVAVRGGNRASINAKGKVMKKAIKIVASCMLFAVIGFFVQRASAEEQYQTVVSGLYEFDEGDQGSRQTSYGLQSRFYFSPVKTDKHPYGEAAFLERIGSVYAQALWNEYRFTSREGDGPLFQIGINAAKPGVPVAVELFYIRSSRDYNAPSTLEVTNDTFGIRAGYFFSDTWLTGIQYINSAWDNTSESYSSIILRQQQYRLFTKYDHDLGQNRMLSVYTALGIYENKDQGEIFRNIEESIQLDYYFTKSLSVGLGFNNSSGTDEGREGQTYSTNIQYYFTSSISANLGFSWFENKNVFQQSWTSYSGAVSARF